MIYCSYASHFLFFLFLSSKINFYICYCEITTKLIVYNLNLNIKN